MKDKNDINSIDGETGAVSSVESFESVDDSSGKDESAASAESETFIATPDSDAEEYIRGAQLSRMRAMEEYERRQARLQEAAGRQRKENLMKVGMTEEQAEKLINNFPEFRYDERMCTMLKQAARMLGAEKKGDGIDRHTHYGHRERMRESAKRDAKLDSFSDIEILEYILSYAIPRKDTNGLAHKLLEEYGTVLNVLHVESEDLKKFPSMTEKAAQLLPMISAACLWEEHNELIIADHKAAVNYLGPLYMSGQCVGTNVVFLDSRYRIIATETYNESEYIAFGTILGSISKYAARYIVLGRKADGIMNDLFAVIESVRKLINMAEAMGTSVLDCFLFTHYGYYTVGNSIMEIGTRNYYFCPYEIGANSPELIHRMHEYEYKTGR